MKKFLIFPLLLLAFALGSCTTNEEEDMTIELASPKPLAEVKGNVVNITWPAIAKSAGYAYRFDQGEYTFVEADVLSFSGKIAAGDHTFEIYAVGNKTHSMDSAVRSIQLTVDVALPMPEPVVSSLYAEATISWPAVDNAEGYAYKIDANDEVKVASEILSITQKFTAGKHTFAIRALGDGVETTDSKANTIEFEIDLTLPSPVLTIAIDGQNATISWTAIEQATGYAYTLDNGTETKVGANVLSYADTFSGGKHTLVIRALGDGVETADSKPTNFPFDVVDTSKGVFLKKASGAIVAVTATSEKIFAMSLDCTAGDSFTVLVDNVEHGFMSFSGNGGVGTVNSLSAALPFYGGYTYYVRESVGRLTHAIDSGASKLNALYVNTGSAEKVYVKIDCSNADGEPRYYLKLDKAPDASIILEQYFDLMVFGGDWTQTNKLGDGTKIPASVSDGTEAGTAKGASYTTVGATLSEVPAAYRANRGVADWICEDYVFEFPGYVRLCNSSADTQYGVLTTPKLSSLSAAATISVAFDGLRFASAGDIAVRVLGGGVISSASVLKDGKGAPITITPEADGKSFLITLNHGTKHGNSDAKPFSNFSFVVEGASSQTQIVWDSTTAGKSGDARYCLDNIVIRRN